MSDVDVSPAPIMPEHGVAPTLALAEEDEVASRPAKAAFDVAPTPVIEEQERPKKAASTTLDKSTIREAYEEVRSDASNVTWVVMKFDGTRIVCTATGEEFEDFKAHFTDGDRGFGYIRIQMGDEMSKRTKFLFLTWIGRDVSVLNRAKMSCDKALIKEVLTNFAVEMQAESQAELNMSVFREALEKAGGANYGTGVRVE